ncbi:MAG: TlpA family protein disulfide reductase, partial [Verrucomicrobia bacterium]|nr:TlpA family protein disulfide reductase [Verrucomicrobiota bacterium]
VPCRAEIPIFNELQGTYGDRGLTVLGVSVDTVGVSEILAFASQLPVEFPIALSSASLEELLGGVASIPTAFIIDAENNLITRHVGFKDRDFWFNEVESLIAPQSIAVPSPELQIRVFGEPTHIELSWVSEFSNWALQATSNPGIGWTTIDVEMGSESENQSVQVDTEGKLFQFFRIVQN